MSISIDIGVKSFAYCILNDNKIISTAKINLSPKKNTNQFIYESLVNVVKDFNLSPTTKLILIENQMGKNVSAIKTQSLLYAILVSEKITNNYTYNVVEVSPTYKLKYITSEKLSYSRKKTLSKNYCKTKFNLTISPDESDAILQYYGYCKKEGIYDLFNEVKN